MDLSLFARPFIDTDSFWSCFIEVGDNFLRDVQRGKKQEVTIVSEDEERLR